MICLFKGEIGSLPYPHRCLTHIIGKRKNSIFATFTLVQVREKEEKKKKKKKKKKKEKENEI